MWPGKNKLGKLLAELRKELRSHLATDRESDHCAKPSTSVDIPGQLDVASARTHLSVTELPTPEPITPEATTPVLVMVPSTSDNTSCSVEHVDSNVITIKPSVKPKAHSITGKLSKAGGSGTPSYGICLSRMPKLCLHPRILPLLITDLSVLQVTRHRVVSQTL